MAKIIEERVAAPDDPIYQTGWYAVHLAYLTPKAKEKLKKMVAEPVASEAMKGSTSKAK